MSGERELARASTADGAPLVATDRALILGAVRDGEPTRLAWEDITHAEWEHERAVLEIDESATEPGSLVRHHIQLTEAGFLPETIRERVQASILVSQHVRLSGARGVHVVARRAGDGYAWQLIFDRGVDAADPEIRFRAQQALDHLRAQTLGR
jgi:hypothetical protein